MLLTSLKGEPVCGLAASIDRSTYQSTWQRSLVLVRRRHERGMRTTKAQRYAKSLRVTDSDVGSQYTRRSKQHQRQKIGGHNH